MVLRLFPLTCALVAGCGRFGFVELPADARGDSAILPPGDSEANGDAPDSAALFDCRMTHPSALFCDGFEGPREETWDYVIEDNGTVAATTTRAFRGANALEVATDTISAYKAARWGVFFPNEISTGDLHLRAYYWIDGAVTWDEQASIVSSGYSVDPYPSTYLRLGPGEFVLQVDQGTFPFNGDLPRNRWVCVELHIDVDAANGSVDLAVDGVQQFATSGIDTLPGAGYSAMDFGIHYATPNQTAIRLWIDEVIADTSPIGCN